MEDLCGSSRLSFYQDTGGVGGSHQEHLHISCPPETLGLDSTVLCVSVEFTVGGGALDVGGQRAGREGVCISPHSIRRPSLSLVPHFSLGVSPPAQWSPCVLGLS